MDVHRQPEKLRIEHDIGFNGGVGRFTNAALREQGQPILISRNLQ
jgi:hypothetical protein